MLDRDLAALYVVQTGVLNQAVSRNRERFPADFMFQMSPAETRDWISQSVISNPGVAMLSGVLNSKRAIRVNIEIMRAFVGLRRTLGSNKKLAQRMQNVEERLGKHDDAFRSVFEDIRSLTAPATGPRRSIGFSGA